MEQTITQEKIRTIDEAVAVLEKEHPRGVNLHYVDYRDDLSGNLKDLNKAIQANDINTMWDDDPQDWLADQEYEGIEFILREQFTEEELDTWRASDEIYQLNDWLQNHDDSDPVKELLHNTCAQLFLYSTGLEIPEYTDGGEKFLNQQGKRIAKKLKIDFEKHQDKLRSLVANSCYGGTLVLIFYVKPKDMFSAAKDNTIRFRDTAHLVIMDRTNGSGDQESIKETIALPFNRENLWIDSAAPGYSIQDVFGFYLPAFEQNPGLLTIKKTRKPKTTSLQADNEKYAEWDKLVKEGKCSFFDPRFNSHDAPYRNDYPAGNKCVRCGKFFID